MLSIEIIHKYIHNIFQLIIVNENESIYESTKSSSNMNDDNHVSYYMDTIKDLQDELKIANKVFILHYQLLLSPL